MENVLKTAPAVFAAGESLFENYTTRLRVETFQRFLPEEIMIPEGFMLSCLKTILPMLTAEPTTL